MPNNKHLDFPARVKIEDGLNNNLKIRAIADSLDKHPSTISKEIKLHRFRHRSKSARFNYNACAHRYDCKKKNVCFAVDGNYPTALLVRELVPGALDGRKWMYIPSTAADCCDDTEAVEAFDASFPPREKKWMPSQEEFYIYSHSSVVR